MKTGTVQLLCPAPASTKSNVHAALFSKQVRKNELVIRQTAFTRSDQVEKVWQQIICSDMFLKKHTAR